MDSNSAHREASAQTDSPSPQTPLGFWQRRYVLRHYGRCDDDALAVATGCRVGSIAAYLAYRGATRSPSQLRAIERLRNEPRPEMSCPAAVRSLFTKLTSRPLTRLDGVLVAGMFLGSVALYAVTAARTVTGEDAGELLGAAHGFGVPHPPGYPLWMLLCWAADHALPFGSAAFRITLVSVISSAAANALLLALFLKTLRSRLAACAGASLFALSLTHWTQAVIPEVYGLNTLFVALCGLLVVRLAERPTAARLLLLAFVAGLACTNHTTAVPVALLLAVAAFTIAPQFLRRPDIVTGALVFGLAPLALFFVLPLAAARHPYVDWGHPVTPTALWAHASRAQYAGVEPSRNSADPINEDSDASEKSHGNYLRRLSIMVHWMGRQFGSPWVLVLPAIGLIALFARQTGLWLVLIGIGWLNSVGVTQYTQFEFGREYIYAWQIFLIPAWLVLAWLAAGALDEVVRWLARLRTTIARPALVGLCASTAAGLAVLGIHDARIADRSQTTAIADFGRAILDVMEPGSLYFPSSDHSTFAVMYCQGVEGYRTDVTLADKYGRIEPEFVDPFLTNADLDTLSQTPPAEQRPIVEALLIRRWGGPVYFANRRDMKDLPDLRLEPVGPIFKVMTADEATAWWQAGEDGSPAPGLRVWDRFRSLTEIDPRQQVDFTVQMIRGDMLYMRGYADLCSGHLAEARELWDRIDGDLAPLKQTFNNIGSALAEHARLPDALDYYGKALAEDPHYVLALRNQALVLRDSGDLAGAIASLQRLIDSDPLHKGARLELAKLYDQQGRVELALSQYESLAVQDDYDPLPWREAGMLLQRIGDVRKAEAAFAESLRIEPRQPQVGEMLDRLRRRIAQPTPRPEDMADSMMPEPLPSAAVRPTDPSGMPVLDPLLAGFSAGNIPLDAPVAPISPLSGGGP